MLHVMPVCVVGYVVHGLSVRLAQLTPRRDARREKSTLLFLIFAMRVRRKTSHVE